jgi:SAM-dependent methyltransferase
MLQVLLASLRQPRQAKLLDKLGFIGRGYSAYYAAFMDRRAAADPRSAVGGMWDEMGELQLATLSQQGLQPRHTLLDIGCGSFRAGRKFIRYLEPGRYTGIDISPRIIEEGKKLLLAEGISLDVFACRVVNDLRFAEFAGQTFDFLLAQSVFTHTPAAVIEECFAHVGRVMHPGSVFCFTFFEGADGSYDGAMENFAYRPAFFDALAARHGLRFEPIAGFAHPRGQKLGRLSHRP